MTNTARQRPNLRRRRGIATMTGSCPSAKTMALKSGMTLTTLDVRYRHTLLKFPTFFFETSFTALHGLEHKMNYLKLVIKTTCIARHMSDHDFTSPSCETFSPGGSPRLKFDGATSPHLQLFTIHTECSQLCYTGENCRVLFLLNRLNF